MIVIVRFDSLLAGPKTFKKGCQAKPALHILEYRIIVAPNTRTVYVHGCDMRRVHLKSCTLGLKLFFAFLFILTAV